MVTNGFLFTLEKTTIPLPLPLVKLSLSQKVSRQTSWKLDGRELSSPWTSRQLSPVGSGRGCIWRRKQFRTVENHS